MQTIQKRDADKNSLETFTNFLEEKLMQQSQALEHLIKKVDVSGDLIKKLIDNLSKGIEKPRMPAKAEPEEVHPTKNPTNSSDESPDNPLLRLGKHMPKYGKLAKDLILKEIHTDVDPLPLVETESDPPTFLEVSAM